MRTRLVASLLTIALVAVSANAAFACNKSKSSAQSASAKSKAKATAVVAESKGSCSYSQAATAVAAESKGSCSTSKASAVVAAESKGSCSTSKTSAVVAADAKGSCGASKASAAVATAQGSKGVVMAAPAGSSCSTSKSKGAMAANTGCDVCDEYAGCDERLTMAGAVTQVVPLKNGVMYVYTSDSPKSVHKIQSAVRHRNDRIGEIVTASAEAELCDGCKSMRGAMASGKLQREVVNVEGGSLTLVTSEDPEVIRAIQEASGVAVTAAKS